MNAAPAKFRPTPSLCARREVKKGEAPAKGAPGLLALTIKKQALCKEHPIPIG